MMTIKVIMNPDDYKIAIKGMSEFRIDEGILPKCDCRLCIRSRKWDEILGRNDLNEIKALTLEIIDILLHVEEDLTFKELKLSGQWNTTRVKRDAVIRHSGDY